MCRNKGLKRPLYLVCLLFEKPQGGHKGPSKKSELKTPKITYVLDGFSKGTENVTKQKYVISEANTCFHELNLR